MGLVQVERNSLIFLMFSASGWVEVTGTIRGKAVVPPQCSLVGQGLIMAATRDLEYHQLRELTRRPRRNTL